MVAFADETITIVSSTDGNGLGFLHGEVLKYYSAPVTHNSLFKNLAHMNHVSLNKFHMNGIDYFLYPVPASASTNIGNFVAACEHLQTLGCVNVAISCDDPRLARVEEMFGIQGAFTGYPEGTLCLRSSLIMGMKKLIQHNEKAKSTEPRSLF